MSELHLPCPDTCASVAVPTELPMMVLSDCWLFPGCFLPLFIFEQRYRDMLAGILEQHRMFCIGTRTEQGSEDVLPVTTAGLVNACVKHEDGTAHLVLMGLRRVRITGWSQMKPYRIAQVEPLPPGNTPCERLHELRTQALQSLPCCDDAIAPLVNGLCEKLRSCKDPALVSDVIAYHFVRNASLLNQLLMEPCAERRFLTLLKAMREGN